MTQFNARLVPALGEDLAVGDDAEFAVVEVLQQLPSLVLRQASVNHGSGYLELAEHLGHLGGVLDVDAEDDGLVAIKGKIQIGGARNSCVSNESMGRKCALNAL